MKKLSKKRNIVYLLYILFIEIVLIFLTFMNYDADNYMYSIFSLPLVLLFIEPMILLSFTIGIPQYIKEEVIIKYTVKKKFFSFLLEKIYEIDLSMVLIILFPIHIIMLIYYKVPFMQFIQYYLSFFLTLLSILCVQLIFYLRSLNKNISFIITYIFIDIINILSSFIEAIPNIAQILTLSNNPCILIITLLVLDVLLILFIRKMIGQLN